MAEEEKKEGVVEEQSKPESKFEETEASPAQAKKGNLFDRLFANDNKLITVSGSDFAISNETRRLLALFSDGTGGGRGTHRQRCMQSEYVEQIQALPRAAGR